MHAFVCSILLEGLKDTSHQPVRLHGLANLICDFKKLNFNDITSNNINIEKNYRICFRMNELQSIVVLSVIWKDTHFSV
jgi:hypothetical protein